MTRRLISLSVSLRGFYMLPSMNRSMSPVPIGLILRSDPSYSSSLLRMPVVP